MNRRFLEEAGALQINGADANVDAEIYRHISEEQLIALGNNLFLYFLHDPYPLFLLFLLIILISLP